MKTEEIKKAKEDKARAETSGSPARWTIAVVGVEEIRFTAILEYEALVEVLSGLAHTHHGKTAHAWRRGQSYEVSRCVGNPTETEDSESYRLARTATRLLKSGDLEAARWRLIDAAALIPAPSVHETGRAVLLTGEDRGLYRRVKKVERLIHQWEGVLWAHCPSWAVGVRAALGMDDYGRYPATKIKEV